MDIKPEDFRRARQAAGMTVQQAADAVHCRYRTWQDWEHGKNPVDIARYRLFCHLTGLERLPFGTIQPEEKSAKREADELQGKIDRMLAGKPVRPEAYRGYLIQHSLFACEVYVMKDGFRIGTYTSVEAAKRDIDMLTEDRR